MPLSDDSNIRFPVALNARTFLDVRCALEIIVI